MIKPTRQYWQNETQFQFVVAMVQELERLRKLIEDGGMGGKGVGSGLGASVNKAGGLGQTLTIPVAQDANAQGGAFLGAGGAAVNPNVPVQSISGGSTGYSFSLATGTYTMSVGNAATIRNGISAAKRTAAIGPIVIGYRLTPAGTDGTVTIDGDGVFTFVPAT